MPFRRRFAFSLIELLIAMAIIAVIAGLTLSLLRGGRESVENLKIAQFVRGGVNRCANLKVQRMPDSIFCVTWQDDQNRNRIAVLTMNEQGDLAHHPLPWPPLPGP